jgi:putative DNA primase/helicase
VADVQAEEKTIRSGMLTVADEKPFHPVRDCLCGLVWDRKPRLDIVLPYYFGTPETPYVRAIGPRWFISGVARVMRPGIKADCCLVLEGPTGLKKSMAARIIGDPLDLVDLGWFTDEIAVLGTKDAGEQTVGIWIVELAELDAVRRSDDIERVKAFMSRATDRFRWSYGHHVEAFPRQCIFIATTEDDRWNHDPRGARRFWPTAASASILTP